MITEVKTVDTHTMGEPTRIVIDTLPEVYGNSMIEKKEYISRNYDYIRKLLMHEPRGHRDMFGAFLLEPCNEDADIGVVFMDSGGYLNMCGHGTIGIVTMCLNKGFLSPKNIIKVDTPSGLITCKITYENNKIKNVAFESVPSFLYKKDYSLSLNENKNLSVNIAFGGSFFSIVDVNDLGLSIKKEYIPELLKYAKLIKEKLNKELKIHHPENPKINSVDLIEFSEKVNDNYYKNLVVFGDGQIDRSPCGTGTCAKLSTLDLKPNEDFIHESILGSTFKGKIIKKTKIGNYVGIIPEITGSAWITGEHLFTIDEDDHYPEGFII